MSRRWGRGLQCAAAALFSVGYAGLSHYCNSAANAWAAAPEVGAALAMAPVAVYASLLVWRETPAPIAALLMASLTGLLYGIWPLLTQNFARLFLLDECTAYGLLGLAFGRSLLPGRLPLCTQLADRLHGPLTPLEVRYTRRVTAVWAVFFLSVTGVSVLLFAWAPLRFWSLYVNFCVPSLVGVLFAAEYLVRRRSLPDARRTSLVETVRVYLETPPSSSAPS